MATGPTSNIKPPKKIVTVDESVIVSMALNKAFLSEFPFLQNLASVVKKSPARGCGSCSRASAERAQIFSSVKTTLATMDSSKKRRLKELLGAEKVRIVYRGPKGKIIEHTIT